MYTKENPIEVYTDGGSRIHGNHKNGHVMPDDPAAWAYHIQRDNVAIEGTHGEFGATNNKMELTAVFEVLKELYNLGHQKDYINLTSDSRYIIDSINEDWVGNWAKNDWRLVTNKEPKNVELWQNIYNLLPLFSELHFKWVKGHASNKGNNRVDELLNQTMDTMEKQLKNRQSQISQ